MNPTFKCEGCGKNIRRDKKYSKSRLKRPQFCSSKCANQRSNSGRFKKGDNFYPNIQFKKGHIPWNKGIKAPSISMGRKSKRKLIANKRRSLSESGIKNPMFGKKHSLETKLKMRGPRPNFVPWNKSKSFLPKEHYQKIGAISTLMQTNNSKPTSIEKKVYDELRLRGFLFETQKLINGKFIVDAYIPSLNLIIEADGDYWHGLEENKKHDKARNAYLTKCGYNMLRLKECDINKDVQSEINKISVYLN